MGPFKATVDGILLNRFRTKSVQALLIYLACQPDQAHLREGLMALLWPGLPQKSAQASLRQSLYLIRKAIPSVAAVGGGGDVPYLVADRQTIQVNPEAVFEADVLSFNRLLQEGIGRFPEAVAFYRGDFLCDFYLPDSVPFEEWTLSWREDLRRRALNALDDLSTRSIRQGDFDGASKYARQQLAIDNLRESAHSQLMEALALAGRRPEALSQYKTYRTLLKDELAAEPLGNIVVLYNRIRDGELITDAAGLPLVRGYELKEEIGAGAYGVVHRAYQPAAGRDVAVKIILPKYTDQPDFSARFDAEAQMVARLEHPHIVPLYDTWRDEDGAHLVMRLLRGGSLKDLLKNGPLEIEAAVKLVEQVASALHVAHKKGIVHRDLKPSNILYDEEGNAYLSDFGIAKNLAAEVTLTPTGAVVGTPDYIAPEQIRGEELTPQADQYSLGLVLFEALTGVHPFAGESIATLFHKHLTEPLQLVSVIRPEIPPGVDSALLKATDKDAAERFPDIILFGEAVRQALLPSLQSSARDPQVSAPALPAFLNQQEIRTPARPSFVARQGELARLAEFLNLVLNQREHGSDQGNVVFVAGDAGSGKTSLMRVFAEQAQAANPDLIVAWGACNAFTGRGDPYLPFRDIMSGLGGDLESAWRTGTITVDQAKQLWNAAPLVVDAIVNSGPALIDTFISGSSLVSRILRTSPENAELLGRLRRQIAKERPHPGEMEQAELFQQLTNVLYQLGNEYPVLLIVDDLQWADSGSINLLFHLGRRLIGSRILLLGAYRPEDLVTEEGKRHPLRPLLDEFKRSFGDVWVDLGQAEGLTFVYNYLDSEPNRLGAQFRQTLFQHTDGHPLFTVELLRDMQERGDLIRDDKERWIESPRLDWSALPARIEGVIEERIGRLEDEMQEILTVAAVEGEDFTARVVARVQEIQERQLMRTLSLELDKRHHLVRESQPVKIGRDVLVRYRFTHTLFQRYLYNDLSAGERRLLHREIGILLEELYEGRMETITVQLARHFVEAGEDEKAVAYLQKAGDRARALYACDEAADYYSDALILLKQRGDHERAARTLMKLGLTYHNAFQFKDSRRAYEEGFALWQRAYDVDPVIQQSPAPHALRFTAAEPGTLDPALSHDSASGIVLDQLFAGLVEINLDMDVVPDVAHSWEISDSGRRYIFRLREDVHWSDGLPVTAFDFEFAWKRALDPISRSTPARLLYDIRGAKAFNKGEVSDPDGIGVQALDAYTLSVELEAPTGYFLQLPAFGAMNPVPKHMVESFGEAWVEPKNLVTNGAFSLKAQSPGESAVLSRNPKYHGRRSGNLQQVELFFTDENSRPVELKMYEENALDVLRVDVFQPVELERLRQRYAGEYVQFPELSTAILRVDASRPPFDDQRVRQAFAMAIDQETLANIVLRGFRFPATGGLIPPGVPGHSPGIGLPYDPSKARQLLSEAGYSGGSGFPPIDTLSAFAVNPVAHYLINQWHTTLGIDVPWESTDWLAFLKKMWEPHHLIIQTWVADYPDPDNLLRVFAKHSWSTWQNVEYDNLVEEARRSTDQEGRMRLYRQADKILVQGAALIPLTYDQNMYLIKPWVRNFHRFHSWKDVVIEPH